MIVTNPNITLKYIRNWSFNKTLIFSYIIANLKEKKQIYTFEKKKHCIYTYRNRSVFSSFKMCRHQLKKFLDARTFSNINIK